MMELPTAFLHLKILLFVISFPRGGFKKGITNNGKSNIVKDFLGVFAKLLKVVMSFLMYVRPSISPHETTRLTLNGIEDLPRKFKFN